MSKENKLYLLIEAMRHLEKQKIVESIGWKRKRSYLKRENEVNCGKKGKKEKDGLSRPEEIIYRCCQVPDLYLID